MLQTNHITSNIPLRHKHKNIIKAIKLCARNEKTVGMNGKTVKNASLFVKKTKLLC